jgi:branched-chain amino acid transport system ATP-binding protein
MSAPYLEVAGLEVHYGKLKVLHGVDLHVGKGEIVLMIGHNGAGKSTTPKAVFGLVRPSAGRITWRGADITGRAAERNVADGMGFVPQGRGVFGGLSVIENLRMGAYMVRDGAETGRRMEQVFALFPVLAERRAQRAGSLSGGQQRMLSIGLALMSKPQLLFIDEPSIGLSPALVDQVMARIRDINRGLGTTIVLIEQNVRPALGIANRVYVLKVGKVVFETTPDVILARESFWDLY